jgi:hypothetical protein
MQRAALCEPRKSRLAVPCALYKNHLAEEAMKLSSMACASFLACAALVLTAGGALAVVNYNASKSNAGNFTFDPKEDLDGPKLCSDAGGTVKDGPGKLSTCVVPAKAPAAPAKAN